jgi:hypothetical protein
VVDSVTLPFAEVEAILGQPLPVTARITPDWWTYEAHRSPHVPLWRALGWEATLDRRGRTVTFLRTPSEASS